MQNTVLDFDASAQWMLKSVFPPMTEHLNNHLLIINEV